MTDTKPKGIRLSAHRVNSAVQNTGEWVDLEDEFEGARILTRGFTDAYFDQIARGLQRAARPLGGDTSKVPTAVRRGINVKALCEQTLMDVSGFLADDGTELTRDQVASLLEDRAYLSVLEAVNTATAKAGRVRAEETKEAAGN